jgi:hypothetical protein
MKCSYNDQDVIGPQTNYNKALSPLLLLLNALHHQASTVPGSQDRGLYLAESLGRGGAGLFAGLDPLGRASSPRTA